MTLRNTLVQCPERHGRQLVCDESDSLQLTSNILIGIDDDALALILHHLPLSSLLHVSLTCWLLNEAYQSERRQRVQKSGIVPEAWLGGAPQLTAAVDSMTHQGFANGAMCNSVIGYTLLRLFPDASHMVGAGSSASPREVSIYTPDGRVVKVLNGGQSTVCCVATDGVHIASADSVGTIILWSVETHERVLQIKAPEVSLFSLAVREELLCAGFYSGRLHVWTISSAEWCTMLTDHVHTNQGVDTVVASIDVDDRAIVSASHDTTARVWRYGAHPRETGDGGGFAIKVDDAPLVLPHPAWVIAVQLAAGVVATGCCDKAVRTFSSTSGQVLRVLHGHRAWVCSVALSGDVLVSSDASMTVRVWSLAEAAPDSDVRTLPREAQSCSLVTFQLQATEALICNAASADCASATESRAVSTDDSAEAPNCVSNVVVSAAQGGFVASLTQGCPGKLTVWRPWHAHRIAMGR